MLLGYWINLKEIKIMRLLYHMDTQYLKKVNKFLDMEK